MAKPTLSIEFPVISGFEPVQLCEYAQYLLMNQEKFQM